jgi:NADH:ubiquinone oxidoreductase subunit 4 (subunit M)
MITAILIVALMVFTVSTVKKGGYELYAALLTQAMVLSIVVVDAMFTYILCERALIPESK